MPSSSLGVYKPLLKSNFFATKKRVSDATRTGTLDTKVALMAAVWLYNADYYSSLQLFSVQVQEFVLEKGLVLVAHQITTPLY